MTDNNEHKFCGGRSEDVAAEYGSSSDSPFTLLEFFAGEPIAVEGFQTQDGIDAVLAECRLGGASVFYV